MMTRIKIEPCTTASMPDPCGMEQLKRVLRISQKQGLIRPTGDPSLDAPITEQENGKENKKEDHNN